MLKGAVEFEMLVVDSVLIELVKGVYPIRPLGSQGLEMLSLL
jgi:hypothetical protein